MPRKPRFFLPGVPVHVVQRGHSREPVFFEDDDYHAYLRWLKAGAEQYKVAIHAYVLMTNHIHILATAGDKDGIMIKGVSSGLAMPHILAGEIPARVSANHVPGIEPCSRSGNGAVDA